MNKIYTSTSILGQLLPRIVAESARAKMGLSVSLFATPYRCAGGVAILGDWSDRSRSCCIGCGHCVRILSRSPESDPSNPRESRRLPRNGKCDTIVTLRSPFHLKQARKSAGFIDLQHDACGCSRLRCCRRRRTAHMPFPLRRSAVYLKWLR